jgi:hypothetical protein
VNDVTQSLKTRWTAALTVILGINLWVMVLVIPAVYGRAKVSGYYVVLMALPLAVLGLGLQRRSVTWLAGVYPCCIALGAAIRNSFMGAPLESPAAFVLAALSLAGYLLGAAASLEQEHNPSPPPDELTPLKDGSTPSRWRRRYRVYTYLVVLSVVFPAAMFYVLNVREQTWFDLKSHFEERAETMRVLLNVALLGVWSVIFFAAFGAPLSRHRRGDPALKQELYLLKTGRKRPVLGMLAMAGVALALVVLFLYLYL